MIRLVGRAVNTTRRNWGVLRRNTQTLRVFIMTNGLYPLKRFDNLYFYWFSFDGIEKVHDGIMRKGLYSKTKIKNILEYAIGPNYNDIPVWKDIWTPMIINSLNYNTIKDLVYEWKCTVNR